MYVRMCSVTHRVRNMEITYVISVALLLVIKYNLYEYN